MAGRRRRRSPSSRADGVVAERGPDELVLRWASVTKLFTAYAALIAAEEGVLDLDEPAGPAGVDRPPPPRPRLGAAVRGRRRRSQARRAADLLEHGLRPGRRAAGRARRDAVRASTCRRPSSTRSGSPGAELRGRPRRGSGERSPTSRPSAASCSRPTLVAPETLAEATAVVFPGLVGVLPGLGRQEPNDWGLGFELKDAKRPHWTGSPQLAPRPSATSAAPGTFLWVDPEAQRRLRLPHRPRVRRVGPGRVAAARGRDPGRAGRAGRVLSVLHMLSAARKRMVEPRECPLRPRPGSDPGRGAGGHACGLGQPPATARS